MVFSRKGCGRLLGAGVVAGLGVLAGAYVEARAYCLRQRTLMLMREGASDNRASSSENGEAGQCTGEEEPLVPERPLRVLHLTDIHLVPTQRKKIAFVRSLAAQDPDLVVLTGDLLAAPDALDSLLYALEPFAGIPGAFVYGSNDYFSPRPKNPLSYLDKARYQHSSRAAEPATEAPRRFPDLPYQELTERLENYGWFNANNQRGRLQAAGWEIDLVGVDDPHIGRDRFPEATPHLAEGVAFSEGQSLVAGADGKSQAADKKADLYVGLTHAPYTRTLNAMLADGRDLVFAGHTHGGQLALPVIGALTTNCDLVNRLDSGLFSWPDTGAQPVRGDGGVVSLEGEMYVNTPTGIGTSPFVPFRAFRQPEAVLLELRATVR